MSTTTVTSGRTGNGDGSKPRLRPDGRWQVNIAHTDDNGVARRHTVYGKTQREAIAKRRELVKRLNEGKPARDAKATVAAVVETWIAGPLAASDRKPTTKAMYTTLARKHIAASTLGTVTIDKLKPSRVESWVAGLKDSGLSQSTVRSTYTVLRAVLDSAVRDGQLGTNPAAVVKRPTVDHHEAAFLTPAQFKGLLEAAQGSRYAPLFELLGRTGMRRGEALALTWRDVDLDKGVLKVRGTLARMDGVLTITAPKTDKSRRPIPLSASAVAVLKAQRQLQRLERLAAGSQWLGGDYVFMTELGAPCDPRNALRALKAAAAKYNKGKTGAHRLPVVGLHTLRHTALSTMLENGAPMNVTSAIAGHSSIAITADIYGHVTPEAAHNAMSLLESAFSG